LLNAAFFDKQYSFEAGSPPPKAIGGFPSLLASFICDKKLRYIAKIYCLTKTPLFRSGEFFK